MTSLTNVVYIPEGLFTVTKTLQIVIIHIVCIIEQRVTLG
jgi:hypothetical protein